MSLDVRIRLDSFDFAHPAEKQVQIFVTVPDVVRVSYLLPERFWEELRDEEWIDALNAAHDYFEQNVWGDTGAEEKKRLREWLAVDEHVDALHAAWFEDRARRDPVSRALLKDKERLTAELSDERELVAAMHAASVGCVREPLLGHVADVAETRAAYLAQQHRADELDVIAKRAETRGVELEQQLAARTFYLADYEGISDGPTLHSTLDAAKAWVGQACSDFEDPAWDWYEQDGVWQQWTSDPDTDRPTSRSAGSVLPLTVAGDGVVAEAQRLRQGFLETVRQAALLTEVRDSQRDEIRRLQTEQGELMQALGGGPYDEWDEVVHRARQLAGAAFVAPAADAVPDQDGAE